MAFKNSDRYFDGLHVYVANERNIDFSVIPSTDTNDVSAVKTYIDSNFTFTRLFAWTGQQLSLDSTQDEQILEASECDLGEIDRSNVFTPIYNGNIMTVRDETLVETIAYLVGGKYQIIPATPVAITDEEIGTNASAGDVYFFQNNNGDQTVVTGVTVNLAGVPLVAGTGYVLSVDDGTLGRKGKSYITFLLDQTGLLEVDYTYTPASRYMIGKSTSRASKKYTILKLVSCAKTPESGGIAVSDEFYLVKAYLNAPFDVSFPAASEEFTPSPMNFAVAKGGDYVGDYANLD